MTHENGSVVVGGGGHWSGSRLDDLPEPPAWMGDALCAETDPESFFPEKGGSTRSAKRTCGSCEVSAQCLAFAVAGDERFGIWGGLSERERRRMKRDPEAVAAAVDAAEAAEARRVRPRPAVPSFRPADLVRPVPVVDEETGAPAAGGALTPRQERQEDDRKAAVAAASRDARALLGSLPKPGSKWKVARVWMATSPDGTVHGPFADQPAALRFVGERLAPNVPEVVAKRRAGATRKTWVRWTEADIETMRDLWNAGLTDSEIARRLGRAQGTTSAKLRGLGLPSNARKGSVA